MKSRNQQNSTIFCPTFIYLLRNFFLNSEDELVDFNIIYEIEKLNNRTSSSDKDVFSMLIKFKF